ncbi:MAG: hypothetical protein COB77_03330 [Gammaproteobacteria bacterium]|nr:MAG: hypothetical protein COB77_03330 [Gammaproteobacteria bacterium]
MKQLPRVLVLGYGEMGHAMEYLLSDRLHIDIWDKYPQINFNSANLETAAAAADIVLFCLPVNPHRKIANQIFPFLKKTCLCISIAKGLDESGQTAAQIFSDVFSTNQLFALLYGPMISEEIRAGRCAFAQLGCDDVESFNSVRELFDGSGLYMTQTADITGISWSVILKNVYALLYGMADELSLGDNMRGYLTVTALRELEQIVRVMGGQAGSPYDLAGVGDLITTGTSENSHHHEIGRKLARGEVDDIEGEGIHTLAMVSKYQLFDIKNYPLFQLIQAIVQQPCAVSEKINAHLKQVYC